MNYPIKITAFFAFILHATTPAVAAEPFSWERAPKIVASIKMPHFFSKDYLITEHGAVGDGVSDSRPAIQKAIDLANAGEGGRVVIPKGTWFSKGPIRLKSNVNLFLEEGATLTFSDKEEDYLPVVLTRWEGTDVYNYSPFIYSYMSSNVGLTGKGRIDGNAKAILAWHKQQRPDQYLARKMGAEQTPLPQRIFGQGHLLRPPLVQFYGGSNVLIQDVTLNNGAFWMIHLLYCDSATVRGVTVDSHHSNNDGVDIESSSNVLIEGSTFSTGDDSVVLKSGRDEDGRRIGRPTENVVVRKNSMTGHSALVIGSEMSGGVHNIFFEDNQLLNVRSAMYFKSNIDRGGMVNNVAVRNISVKTAEKLIQFETNYKAENLWIKAPSTFRNFLIEDISAENVKQVGVEAIGTSDAFPISNVLIRRLKITHAAIPFRVKFIQDFVLEDTYINGIKMPEHPQENTAIATK